MKSIDAKMKTFLILTQKSGFNENVYCGEFLSVEGGSEVNLTCFQSHGFWNKILMTEFGLRGKILKGQWSGHF